MNICWTKQIVFLLISSVGQDVSRSKNKSLVKGVSALIVIYSCVSVEIWAALCVFALDKQRSICFCNPWSTTAGMRDLPLLFQSALAPWDQCLCEKCTFKTFFLYFTTMTALQLVHLMSFSCYILSGLNKNQTSEQPQWNQLKRLHEVLLEQYIRNSQHVSTLHTYKIKY